MMNLKSIAQIFVAPLLILTSVVPSVQGQVPGQPADEASAQKWLPRSKDPIWSKLIQCKVNYDKKTGEFGINVTPEVRALDGQTVSVRGFVLPMDGADRTKHFLLTRNTPVCLYCPPGEPNEIIEVVSERAVEWTDSVVTVTGKMSLIDNGENALFFKITVAQVRQ